MIFVRNSYLSWFWSLWKGCIAQFVIRISSGSGMVSSTQFLFIFGILHYGMKYRAWPEIPLILLLLQPGFSLQRSSTFLIGLIFPVRDSMQILMKRYGHFSLLWNNRVMNRLVNRLVMISIPGSMICHCFFVNLQNSSPD